VTTEDDEQRWARVEETLARWRREPVERRVARERRDQQLFLASLVFVGLVLALALVLLVVDPPPDPGGERPAWRAITGLSVSGAGLLSMLIAAALRVPRRGVPVGFGSLLRELTMRQRKELIEQVRGGVPVMPERIRLARLSAEELLGRRGALVFQAGLLVVFLGNWIADRSLVRTILTLLLFGVFAAAAVQAHRDEGRARRFLEEHPPPPP
jgi:hypothetical protein